MLADDHGFRMKEKLPSEKEFENALDVLRGGGIIAFPTETYYGLGVDIFNETALHALFHLKSRDKTKPILVLVDDLSMLDGIVTEIPGPYEKLIEKYWPGPLTLIFPANPTLSSLITGATGTIGVRMSPHPVASQLCGRWGRPLTATSANLSGDNPASSAEMVKGIFGEKIDYVLDGGDTFGGKCSTVVGIDQQRLCCIRDGQIAFKDILKA